MQAIHYLTTTGPTAFAVNRDKDGDISVRDAEYKIVFFLSDLEAADLASQLASILMPSDPAKSASMPDSSEEIEPRVVEHDFSLEATRAGLV